ncbi:hypothetical protein [Sphingomonas sp.]|nr:hypothetical protein [Sphingomonas sp.]MBO9713606.1 hypothetical protein [Sphingomonas sp.]
MKRALVVLIVGTILSGLAAAYAATTQRMDAKEAPAGKTRAADDRVAALD